MRARASQASGRLRAAIIAGQGVDSKAWLEQLALPSNWIAVSALTHDIPNNIDLVIWLWRPFSSNSALNTDKQRLKGCLRSFRNQGNRLAPWMLVEDASTTPPASREDLNQDWPCFIRKSFAQYFAKTLHRIGPVEIASPLFLRWNSTGDNQQVVLQGHHLVNRVKHWRKRLRRQATWLVQLAAGITLAYLLLLIGTISVKSEPPAAPSLLALSPRDWKEKLQACQAFLAAIQEISLPRLTASQRGQFAEQLRWLPLANEIFQQRGEPSKSNGLQQGVRDCLNEMENRLAREFLPEKQPPSSSSLHLERLAQYLGGTRMYYLCCRQQLLCDVLRNAFDPRPENTVLHQVADQFWRQERELTILMLNALGRQRRQQIADDGFLEAVKGLLQDRLRFAKQAPVHNPPRQIAWEQELEQALSWCAALQQARQPLPDPAADATMPALLRQAGLTPGVPQTP